MSHVSLLTRDKNCFVSFCAVLEARVSSFITKLITAVRKIFAMLSSPLLAAS